MKQIYLDYNGTTPIDKEVSSAMKPILDEHFGNPSSGHYYGLEAHRAIEVARQQVADLVNGEKDEIIFTSGGTESNNWALKGIAFENKHKGNHIITSAIEHPAIIEVCKYLARNGFEISYIPVDEYGMVNPDDIVNAIKKETILISVMHANNEVGTIQPNNEIGEIANEHNILFHSDAAQSLGKITVDVKKMNLDLLSLAGHKIYAPKGVGALYIKKGTKIQKFIHGASQEMDLRAGTENVLEIVGLGKACEIANRDMDQNSLHFMAMRDLLYDTLVDEFPEIKLNGHPSNRLPNTLSLSFYGKEANALLSDLPDIAASAGAACHADSITVSHVLEAMMIPENYAKGTIRFSTGKYTSKDEILKVISLISELLK